MTLETHSEEQYLKDGSGHVGIKMRIKQNELDLEAAGRVVLLCF